MIYQTNVKMPDAVQHMGCYLWCLLSIAEEYTGKPIDEARALELYKQAMADGLVGWMDGGVFRPGEKTTVPIDGCWVQKPIEVLKLAGVDKPQIVAGPLDAGMWPVDAPIPEGVCLIQKWKNNTFKHFVRGNPDRTVRWDPIRYPDGSGSVTVRQGALQSVRMVMCL